MSTAAIRYICNIMTPDDTLSLKTLISCLERAPLEAHRFFQRCCHNVKELEVFLKENPHIFYVENKKVALYEEQLEEAEEKSVLYFKDKMKHNYSGPEHYMDLKKKHFDEAPDEIKSFMRRFYPGKEFKKFFLSRSDVFFVHHGAISLIEFETVQFYEKFLNLYGPMSFKSFRGHIGHAPMHIQKYVNKYYSDKEFIYFLEKNNNKFRIDNENKVHFA